jgi:hypothetical protein
MRVRSLATLNFLRSVVDTKTMTEITAKITIGSPMK